MFLVLKETHLSKKATSAINSELNSKTPMPSKDDENGDV